MVYYRQYVTESGLHLIGGKNAETNDRLVYDAKSTDVLLHTSSPGSPFVNAGTTPSSSDLKEAAIFCAKYSQEWRDKKSDVIVNRFLRADMNKSSKMKEGTWEVKKKEKIRVKKSDILKYEKELRSEGIALGE